VYITGNFKNPFEIEHIPFIVKLYILKNVPSKGLSLSDKILRKLVKTKLVYKLMRWFKSQLKGTFYFEKNGEKKKIIFNGTNTQFHSIYFPQYKNGYEPETSYLISFLLSGDKTFYDIGANWGHFSLLAASLPEHTGEIHSFEPFVYQDLITTVKLGGLETQIQCHSLALSNENNTGFMESPDNFHTGLAHLTEKKTDVPVEIRKIDDLTLKPADVIKIDAEGAEYNILLGAKSLLEKHKPSIIFENWINEKKSG